MKATALAALAACCSLLPLAALAEHTVTTKQEKDVFGRMNANLFVHHFTTKVESESYMGTNEQNTRCVKWGTARLFGEERKCVLVDPKDSVRYKVTVGPSSGILYWQRIDFTGRVIKDITTGSGNQGIEQMGARDTMTGGQMLLSWVYHMLDDDESGTIDPGEMPAEKIQRLDKDGDGDIDADDLKGLTAKAVFELFDDDDSGLIEANELPSYLLANMEQADGDEKNDNDLLTLEEFTTLFQFRYKQHRREHEEL